MESNACRSFENHLNQHIFTRKSIVPNKPYFKSAFPGERKLLLFFLKKRLNNKVKIVEPCRISEAAIPGPKVCFTCPVKKYFLI